MTTERRTIYVLRDNPDVASSALWDFELAERAIALRDYDAACIVAIDPDNVPSAAVAWIEWAASLVRPMD